MDNETKLSNEQISELFSFLKSDKKDERESVDSFVKEHLSNEQAAALQNALKNPAMIKMLLSSPQAKKLIEKFNQGGAKE